MIAENGDLNVVFIFIDLFIVRLNIFPRFKGYLYFFYKISLIEIPNTIQAYIF